MAKKNSALILDCSQPIFVGIDVHKKRWSITLIHRDQILERCTLPGEITVLGNFILNLKSIQFMRHALSVFAYIFIWKVWE
jgi:hypothetical protein